MSMFGVTVKHSENWNRVVDDAMGTMTIIIHKTTIDMFTRIIERTPVDTGRTRANWQFWIGTAPTEVLNRFDKAGSDTIAAFIADIQTWDPVVTAYIANNVPWITALEDGGYPDPPKQGTYIKRGGKKGKYEIKSQGGYSKQAPSGMVKITIAEFRSILEKVSHD